ncbi:MAG: arabinofuranosidase catalytic domain-containing protein [Trebonia sp.]
MNFGTECWFTPCSGSGGPWVMADMENGLFSGGNGSDPGPVVRQWAQLDNLCQQWDITG